MPVRFSSALLLATAIALVACDREAPAPTTQETRDPAIIAALSDPIMIDPDLALQNRGNAAIALGGFDAVPLEDSSPERIAAAKAEASRLVGGMIKTAPEPAATDPATIPALTAGDLAAALPIGPAGCLAGLRYGYAWAAGVPPVLPIYPRGHVQEAAGNAECGLRAIVFTTPVEPAAVIDFYYTRADDAGYSAERRRVGEVDVLRGAKGAAAFLVRVSRKSGVSEVELAVRG